MVELHVSMVGVIWSGREAFQQFFNIDQDKVMVLAEFFHDGTGLAPTRGRGLEVRGDHGISNSDLMHVSHL